MELDTSYVTGKRISKLSNQVSNRNLNASYVTVKLSQAIISKVLWSI